MDMIRALNHFLAVSFDLLQNIVRFLFLSIKSATALRAENLFLRRQLGLYAERKVKARRAYDGNRLVFVLLSRAFAWRDALVVVRPETLIRGHRKGFRLFWRWKSKRRGWPPLPMEIQRLIVQMAELNVTWGEERIAAELLLKLGVRVSPRTIRRYMPHDAGTGNRLHSQQWASFVRNHAKAIVACDFFMAVTASFRMLYVLVIMEVGTRRIIHFNVTDHPTSEWTLQQFCEAIHEEQGNRFLIHDRDNIYSTDLDSAIEATGLRILKTPVRAPTANAYCERLIGTIRRECLDFMIPLNERHLRHLLTEWVVHYNKGRPHSSLGPGIPDPTVAVHAAEPSRHRIPRDHRVVAKPVLGGLHHEYRLAKLAA